MHVDMDAFFASVEQRDNPELRGKPVAVGGGGPRGVVAAASYEARVFGVRSAMPGSRARRLCPELIFVPHRFDVYKRDSATIRELFRELTDLVEPLSLDEAYLDITHMKLDWPGTRRVALELKQAILDRTSLTASAGVSFNKFLAKMASDQDKPDGLTMITPKEADRFLAELPIERFFGVGKVTANRMQALGLRTGSDILRMSELELASRFGKLGRYLFKVIRGQDDRPVVPHRERKSVSVERTYDSDIKDEEQIADAIQHLGQLLSERLKRTESNGHTINLKVRFDNFKTLTRQMKRTTLSIAPESLAVEALELFRGIEEQRPVRLLGIGISDLISDDSPQLKLHF